MQSPTMNVMYDHRNTCGDGCKPSDYACHRRTSMDDIIFSLSHDVPKVCYSLHIRNRAYMINQTRYDSSRDAQFVRQVHYIISTWRDRAGYELYIKPWLIFEVTCNV